MDEVWAFHGPILRAIHVRFEEDSAEFGEEIGIEGFFSGSCLVNAPRA
jgi:hypothetical protein